MTRAETIAKCRSAVRDVSECKRNPRHGDEIVQPALDLRSRSRGDYVFGKRSDLIPEFHPQIHAGSNLELRSASDAPVSAGRSVSAVRLQPAGRLRRRERRRAALARSGLAADPLLLFNREGDRLAAKLRPGNVHSGEGGFSGRWCGESQRCRCRADRARRPGSKPGDGRRGGRRAV